MGVLNTRMPLALGCGTLLLAAFAYLPTGAPSPKLAQDGGADGSPQQGNAMQPRPERKPLRLRYLANEGFLIEVGDKAVLFDAFIAMPYAGYPAMGKDLVGRLRRAEAPFAGIDLALTSHGHADHFQERVARDFLIASPETALATTPQAIAALNAVAKDTVAKDAAPGAGATLAPRLHAHHPAAKMVETRRFGDLSVRFLRLPHGGMPDVQNLGTLLTIQGHTVLHLGDADVQADDFRPYAEVLRDVDIALVPYWFYATKKGRRIVADFLPARVHVAMHFPKRQLGKVVKSFLANHDGVLAFSRPLEEATFE